MNHTDHGPGDHTDTDTGNGTGTGNGQGTTSGRPGLNLDARQRAMLEEMGVPVWWPEAVPEPATPAPPSVSTSALRPVCAPSAGHPNRPAVSAPPAAPTAAPVAMQAPAARPLPATATATTAASPAAPRPANTAALPGASGASGTWSLQAPQPLFPHADPQHTPAALGAGWLVVVEGRAGSDPLAGDAGRLLENMLRALRLHRHPRTFVCLLDAAPSNDGAATLAGSATTLESAMALVQPSVLLLLGRTVARALLGRTDPLGRLRTEPLQVAGVPAVVSYDAPYLLRAPPETKALVWADLCRARALAGAAAVAAGVGAVHPHA